MVGCRWILTLSLLPLLLFLPGCSQQGGQDSACASCHRGLEPASPTHGDCVACHGGNPKAQDKRLSHRGMLVPKNPSDPRHWEKSCGRCHPYQLQRMRSNLMYTNTGMVKNIQLTWEGEDGHLYATAAAAELFDAEGKPLALKSVAELDNLSGELYRKFCSQCHVGSESNQVWSGSHASGCAACHFPYNDNATYAGGDRTIQGRWPYSESHRMEPLPGNRVCGRCHNRSGRIALTYEGLNDGNNGLVPTRNGEPGPVMIGGVRNATAITPDVHFAKGMECIDCHTSRDVMGDGYAYENMYLQTEIACEDCHGSASERPRLAPVSGEGDEALRESRSYPVSVAHGQQMVLTAKGRKYSNVFWDGSRILVQGKRSGKLHESKVITGTPEHSIVGHERLECYSCHSRAVPQCYGCHTRYDQGVASMDFIKGKQTPGAFSESEDYRTLYPFPLALNQRGKISPVTPGCQTFVTVADPAGNLVQEGVVKSYKGKAQLRFAPFYSHNIGTKAVGCAECHGNPAFLGFGQHVLDGATIRGTLICERSADKPLDGFLTLRDGVVKAFSAITREHSRPLDGNEIRRTWAVNQCLVCHNDPKDPIYQKDLDYRALDTCLARPAAGPVRR